jgi:hypothetical protein
MSKLSLFFLLAHFFFGWQLNAQSENKLRQELQATKDKTSQLQIRFRLLDVIYERNRNEWQKEIKLLVAQRQAYAGAENQALISLLAADRIIGPSTVSLNPADADPTIRLLVAVIFPDDIKVPPVMVPVPEIAPPAPVVTIPADVRFPVTDTAVPSRLTPSMLPPALVYPVDIKLPPAVILPVVDTIVPVRLLPFTIPVALTNPATINPVLVNTAILPTPLIVTFALPFKLPILASDNPLEILVLTLFVP